MSVRLYMDVHIPIALVKALRERGVDVLRAQEDGAERLADPDLLSRATALGRVLFTFDRDLTAEATRRQHEGQTFAGVLFLRQRHFRLGHCLAEIETLMQAGEPEDFEGQVHYVSHP